MIGANCRPNFNIHHHPKYKSNKLVTVLRDTEDFNRTCNACNMSMVLMCNKLVIFSFYSNLRLVIYYYNYCAVTVLVQLILPLCFRKKPRPEY